MLASLDDIKTHLSEGKLSITDGDAKVSLAQIDAERIIKGHLSGTYSPTTLAAWSDPDSTPELIRAIAGRFIAAFLYARSYSEDNAGKFPEYAQSKYAEAMGLLNEVISGTIILPEVTTETADKFSDLRFWPNDSTAAPSFTRDMIF